MNSKAVISLKDISKTYITGPVKYQALKDIDLEVEKGEFIAIMGPSGSGKSTLMNIIGALDKPTGGTYYLAGKEIGKYSDDALANIRNNEIGFVFQSFNLLPRTSAIKNIERPMMYAGIPPRERIQKAKKALEDMLIADKAESMPNHLSGGQMQRIAIARALVMNPSIILADEPTGALDTKTAEDIMKLFTELNDRGHTIVLITHEENIADFAKRIIRLKDGRIISDSTKRGAK